VRFLGRSVEIIPTLVGPGFLKNAIAKPSRITTTLHFANHGRCASARCGRAAHNVEILEMCARVLLALCTERQTSRSLARREIAFAKLRAIRESRARWNQLSGE